MFLFSVPAQLISLFRSRFSYTAKVPCVLLSTYDNIHPFANSPVATCSRHKPPRRVYKSFWHRSVWLVHSPDNVTINPRRRLHVSWRIGHTFTPWTTIGMWRMVMGVLLRWLLVVLRCDIRRVMSWWRIWMRRRRLLPILQQQFQPVPLPPRQIQTIAATVVAIKMAAVSCFFIF